MTSKSKNDQPLSVRDGMIFGGIWSVASVGWIAAIALVLTWFRSGWNEAMFWFGLILLMGAGVFASILAITLLCEALNITTKRSRRDALNYFGWAFLYNLVIGGFAILIVFSFDEPQTDPIRHISPSEQDGAGQPATRPEPK